MNQPTITSKKFQGWPRRILVVFVMLVVVLATYIGYTIYHVNFRAIVRGEAYRSGQMSAQQFARTIQDYGIKSILNLQGETLKASWYRDEIETAAKWNVVHYDRKLSAGHELNVEQMDELIALLRAAPKPILIHCKAGSDRTGLVSALYCLALEGQTPAQADRQLTIWYGHIPLLQTIAMDHSFWRYVSNHTAQVDSNLRLQSALP
jgi:protein tyrosine/serine phosphatase